MKYYARTSSDITNSEREHMELARRLAGECVVLLENDGTLPMEAAKVALYGMGARRTIKGGTGSGDVNSRFVINVEDGLKESGFEITTTDWIDRNDEKILAHKAAYLKWMKEEAIRLGIDEIGVNFSYPMKPCPPVEITEKDIEASDCDTAIYVIARNAGEGADRMAEKGDYYLFDEERENLRVICENYSKVIVILNIGGVMDLSWVKEYSGISSLLLMTQLGNIGGQALADVLTGKDVPSGKLSDTWAVNYLDYPSSANFSHNNGNCDDEYYEDGIYVGYRYFDKAQVPVVYPFGYGISYTCFSNEVVDFAVEKNQVTVKVQVKNQGESYSGKEVIQVYVAPPQGTLAKPVKELKAFAKTKNLMPGEEEVVVLTIKVEDCASYSEELASWVLEAGEYQVLAGNSSADVKHAGSFAIKEAIVTKKLKNLFKKDHPFEEIILEEVAADVDYVAAENTVVDAKDIACEEIAYQKERKEFVTDKKEKVTFTSIKNGEATLADMIAQLTVEEMAEIAVGTLRPDGDGSVIGNASATVLGAAGDTTAILYEDREVMPLIMADGPAGLRLQPHFKTYKETGKLVPGGDILGDVVVPFPENLNPDEINDYYQYCTAIPIGWGLAQSWNEDLIVEIGDMVGEEMEEYHVQLWLAPALNIHRNPLCGRNFEYYSEDPVLSGKIAAAMTKGVQKHEGCGTCIKHFAVNNQEENRYFVNEHVGERALREIYLKGFEIAVKESQPLTLMTSYNLINGTHAANHHDLLQSVLRDEWGYEGFVMTDWFTSQYIPMLAVKHQAKYPISASAGCVYAGNDVQMPGCQKNVDDIIKAVNLGEAVDGFSASKADLQQVAYKVLNISYKCWLKENR